MLNKGTLCLADDLDSKKENFSAKGLATLGSYTPLFDFAASAGARPAPRSRFAGVSSFFGGLFDKAKSAESGIAGAFAPLAGKVFSAATALGVNVPLDRDINSLQNKKDDLASLLSEASEMKDGLLRKIGTKSGPTAQVGKNIASAIVQGKAVLALLDKSQALLQSAKSQLLAGGNPVTSVAQGMAIKKVALTRYAKAVQSLRSVISTAYSAQAPRAKPQAVGAPRTSPIPNFGGMGGGGVPANFQDASDDDSGIKPDPKAKRRKSSSGMSLDLGSYGPLMLAAAAATAAYFAAKPRRQGA